MRPLLLIVSLCLLISCENHSKTTSIIEIDLAAEYPKKDILLSDYVDPEYIRLETHEDALISSIAKYYISDTKIIVSDKGKIIIFDRNGNFINSFSRQGKANNEYEGIKNMVVDFDTQEIFIQGYSSDINVYTFDGDYKRMLDMEVEFLSSTILDHDKDYMIAVDDKYLDYIVESEDKINKQPYMLISKVDGQIKPISLHIEKRYGNKIIRKVVVGGKNYAQPIQIQCSKLQNKGGENTITEYALDSIYKYDNHILTPIISIKNKGGKQYLTEVIANGSSYIAVSFIEKAITEENGSFKLNDTKKYLCNKKTGEIIEMGEVKDELLSFGYGFDRDLPKEYFTLRSMEAIDLVDLLEEGKLSDKAKEIASDLEIDDNPILILGRCKE